MKNQKLVKFSASTKPNLGWNTPLSIGQSLASRSSQRAVQTESKWGKTCSLDWKKQFSPYDFGLFGHVYNTTGCFDRCIKTLTDVILPWEFKIEPVQWCETARNLNAFYAIVRAFRGLGWHWREPFKSLVGHFFAELCNPITRQTIDLECCSNPLWIQQVL